MAKKEIEMKINHLRKLIAKYNKLYYDENISAVPDTEYDSLIYDLTELEKMYPEFQNQDSPTKKVGGVINTKFAKYRHQVPMLSLANAFSKADLTKFDERIKKMTKQSHIDYYCEYKIDGLSLSLEYDQGKLIAAATRGDGEYGEEILENVKMISSIPQTIQYKGKLLVRGEVFFTKDQLAKINAKKLQNKEKPFANARNAASGTLRQLDKNIVKQRNLSAFFYFLYKSDNFITHSAAMAFLDAQNFPTNKEHNKIVNSIEAVFNYLQVLEYNRNSLNYDVDGVAIKVNKFALQKLLGSTSKFPRWAIAYKFLAIRAETILEDIIPTVGRTGKITYKAKLHPVKLAGSVIKSATLHNADYIINNDIRIGDHVLIKKSGDIIPRVIKPVLEKREPSIIKWKLNLHCPNCNTLLVKKDSKIDQYCPNPKCHQQHLRLIEHFVAKKGMNIQGVSKKILLKLYDLEYINSFSSIYELAKYEDKIIALDNMGQKSFDNLKASIEKSKNVTLEHFICALGIRDVGEYTANILSKNFKTLDRIINLSLDKLKNIKEIGEVTAKSIFAYFHDQKNIAEIKKLFDLGINIIKKDLNDKFLNKTFLFTGTLTKSRDYYIKLIKQFNGNVANNLSSKVNYLVLGENYGNKYSKAKKLKIKIINEKELNGMCNN